jgi:hypothetical protein
VKEAKLLQLFKNKENVMNELIYRQFSVMRQTIDNYRSNNLNLNSLVQRIQGAGGVIDNVQWGDAIFPIILEMEQINADIENSGITPTKKDMSDIEKHLLEIEKLIIRFESQWR